MQSLQAWEYPDSWNVADMHMRMFSKLATIALALTTLLILRTDFGKSRHGLVTAFVVLIASLIISTFAYGTITHEQRSENLRFLLGIRRPEETTKRVLQFMAFFICFIAPVLIFLRIGSKYVLLDERLYYQLVYPLAAFVLASFLIPGLNRCLNDYPRWMSLAARVGFCIPALACLSQ